MDEQTLNDALCTYLLSLIDQSGLSINKVADLAGISQSQLNKVLTKHLNLSQKYIERSCAVLDVPLEDFYRGALKWQYSVDELKMHKIIHDTNEKSHASLLTLLSEIQKNLPKSSSKTDIRTKDKN